MVCASSEGAVLPNLPRVLASAHIDALRPGAAHYCAFPIAAATVAASTFSSAAFSAAAVASAAVAAAQCVFPKVLHGGGGAGPIKAQDPSDA